MCKNVQKNGGLLKLEKYRKYIALNRGDGKGGGEGQSSFAQLKASYHKSKIQMVKNCLYNTQNLPVKLALKMHAQRYTYFALISATDLRAEAYLALASVNALYINDILYVRSTCEKRIAITPTVGKPLQTQDAVNEGQGENKQSI